MHLFRFSRKLFVKLHPSKNITDVLPPRKIAPLQSPPHLPPPALPMAAAFFIFFPCLLCVLTYQSPLLSAVGRGEAISATATGFSGTARASQTRRASSFSKYGLAPEGVDQARAAGELFSKKLKMRNIPLESFRQGHPPSKLATGAEALNRRRTSEGVVEHMSTAAGASRSTGGESSLQYRSARQPPPWWTEPLCGGDLSIQLQAATQQQATRRSPSPVKAMKPSSVGWCKSEEEVSKVLCGFGF